MRMRLLQLAALGLLLGACASGPPPAPAPPPPPPLDPQGTYDVTFLTDAGEVPATMTIEGTREMGYTGAISAEMGTGSMTQITLDGQTMTFTIPEVGATCEIVFDGNTFSGWMTGDIGQATLTGTKRLPN